MNKNQKDDFQRDRLSVQTKDGEIYSHIRKKWLIETPEEIVRQNYLLVLVNEYGYSLDQIDEELTITGRGSGKARADFVIWKTVEDKQNSKSPIIIVECKSDSVTIRPHDYTQGDNYARISNAPFFVTHNSRETKYWRVKKDRMPGYIEEIENIPHADATDKEIEELISRLKIFKEEEFAQLLHQCHNVIRNREKKDPAAAFDEIAKILFVKVWVEREMRSKHQRQNLFTADFLESQLGDNPLDFLFQKTKEFYKADYIFESDEHINLKPATGKEIVRLLEKYNLSDTSEDIKGIAFERFLGRTFRGEIGQFFTPRTIVEFMIRMVTPKEKDIICDPASGSGGFLIRFFEIVREQILADIDREYQQYRAELDKKKYALAKKAELLRIKFRKLQESIDPRGQGSRVWKLSNTCIYGTDANDRMARTSKMNMIMHGDGHGGVHHHDGFINVNGIFEERFDIVLTNPPFGANVEPSDVILESNITASEENYRRYAREYGDLYKRAQEHIQSFKGKPIASLFDLPKSAKSNVKTEILFIERCLSLLKPGGRLGIVLPEGIFNNPSLQYVRRFCEDRAFIKAIVSIPQETFLSSGTTVKTSLLFVQKFTLKEKAKFDSTYKAATEEIKAKYANEITKEVTRLEGLIEKAKKDKVSEKRKELQNQLKSYQKKMEGKIDEESRQLLKQKLNYPVFFYDAEKVGITATGEEDQNELYPNNNQPKEIEKTAIEHYQSFLKNPKSYLIGDNN